MIDTMHACCGWFTPPSLPPDLEATALPLDSTLSKRGFDVETHCLVADFTQAAFDASYNTDEMTVRHAERLWPQTVKHGRQKC